jgi:hypothetical protein
LTRDARSIKRLKGVFESDWAQTRAAKEQAPEPAAEEAEKAEEAADVESLDGRADVIGS